ncbi:hypothetical protein GLOIN_2v1770580 [Rhizophagus clarus]|uniref:Uncharacterized protein n=1 Tax=Rhizophagus clarus TaxID=94130 RepID=A0A8H3QL02_9GLOM|nr:hypothetical protein GLOIN_2v1770580 [Rhizophagus clarus]
MEEKATQLLLRDTAVTIQLTTDLWLPWCTFTIATDNGMNFVKAARLLRENYHNQIKHQYCVAYTLQLSAERLHASQQNSQINLSDNEYVNPLEVLTDVKTSLIYEEEDSDVVSDDEYISTGGTRQYLQHSHHQFHHQRRKNTRNREYLQLVNTEGLLQKVHAAIFLSLDEVWPAPSNIMLVATFLDPRFKRFD